jgi:hypothetical protein
MSIGDTPVASKTSPFPLGDVIAERNFTLYEGSREKRQICVRIGSPVLTSLDGGSSLPTDELAIFRCPLQITGLDCDERVFAPAGNDAFMAIQNAIHLAGDILDSATERLKLVNPLAVARERHKPGGPHFADAGRSSWLWHYDSRPNRDYGLQFGSSDPNRKS